MGNLLQTLEGHEENVRSLAFSPNGLIASGSKDGTVKIWDTRSGSCLHTLTDHEGGVSLVTILTGGQRVMSVSHPGTEAVQVCTWDIRGKFLRKAELKEKMRAVAVSADGQRVAISRPSRATVTVWDALGNCLQTIVTDGPAISLAYSTDGKLVTGSGREKAQVWDVSGNCLQKFDCKYSVDSVAFSADGQRVAGTAWTTVKVWDTTLGNATQTVEHHKGLNSFAVSADGQQFATGSSNGTIKLWDVSGNCIHTFNSATSTDEQQSVNSVAFSNDGRRIVASGFSVQIWDVATGDRTYAQTVVGRATSVAFSADGQQVVAGTRLKSCGLQIWDATSGNCTHTFEIPNDEGGAVAFSIDSRHVASASRRIVTIWEVASGNCIQTFTSDHRIRSLAFSNDDQRVLVGCRDFSTTLDTEIWDTSGKRIQTIKDYHGPLCRIANLSDDERTALSSGNEQLRSWGISSGDFSWITLNGKPVFWLPPEYRPFFMAYTVHGSKITIGTCHGTLCIIRFADNSGIPWAS